MSQLPAQQSPPVKRSVVDILSILCLLAALPAWSLNCTEAIGQEPTPPQQIPQQQIPQRTKPQRAVPQQTAAPAQTERSPASSATGQDSQPISQAELYNRLSTRRLQLDFKEVSIQEALQTLSRALGASIKMDLAGIPLELPPHVFNLSTTEPVSLFFALRQSLEGSRLHSMHITLTEQGVQIIKHDVTSPKYILMSHDLRNASDYSTLLRRGIIEQLKQEITPDEWKKVDGPWIVPGTTVFTIHVYHRAAEQQAIRKWWEATLTEQHYGKLPSAEVVKPKQELSPPETMLKIIELRKQYPFESLAGRLEYESGKADQALVLARSVQDRLADTEKSHEARSRWHGVRSASLQRLHGNEVANFISRDGFGFSRRPEPSPSSLPAGQLVRLTLPSSEIDPSPQHERPARLLRRPEELPPGVPQFPSELLLTGFHADQTNSFLIPDRFGFVKDREHVAGFASHAIQYRIPRLEDNVVDRTEPAEQWAMRRIELVSLLKQKEPRVYSSHSVPRMEELAAAQTRALNDFETAALAQLHTEEDLVARATTNRIEMVGAIRAGKECLACHQVTRGQLLGAFSYTLVRDPLLKPAEGE